MAESTSTTINTFHLIMRDDEEGGLHYASDLEPYFSMSDEVLATLSDGSLEGFAHELVSKVYREGLKSNPDDVGMAPWFEIEALPAGSVVPQLIGSREALEVYLIENYKNACCIGWE